MGQLILKEAKRTVLGLKRSIPNCPQWKDGIMILNLRPNTLENQKERAEMVNIKRHYPFWSRRIIRRARQKN